jgi:CheY-like chemotaxis protein
MEILVAEDEAVSRTLVQHVLMKAGHRVTLAADGQEAWAAWQTGKQRIIVSDWLMPVSDGLEMCRRLRSRHSEPYTYFILLTGRTGRENFLEAMAAGVDDFMTKPVDAEELIARVQAAERILGLRQELHFLEGLLPICSYCKRIRDDKARWLSLESYVQENSNLEFSHGVCPDCYARHLEPHLEGHKPGEKA